MKCGLILFFGILFGITNNVTSTQFLVNAPRAIFDFVSLASSSASQNSAPLSRIVDYRTKEVKAAELDHKKENLEQGDQDLERQGTAEPSGANNESMNEATPSFLQKKINKIITKLRILAQLKNAFSYSPQQYPAEGPTLETSTTHSNVTITFEDPKPTTPEGINSYNSKNNTVDVKFNTDIENNNTSAGSIEETDLTNGTDAKENSLEQLRTNDPKRDHEPIHHVYSIARRGKVMARGPEKLDLEVEKPFLANRRSDTGLNPKHIHKKPLQNILNNQNGVSNTENTVQGSSSISTVQDGISSTQNNVPNVQSVAGHDQPNRFGSVGVFFAELLATMVGLAYGAVAQITSSGNNVSPAIL